MALAFGIDKYLRFDSPGDVAGNPLSIAFRFHPDGTSPVVDNWILRGGHSSGLYCFRVDTVIGQAAQLRFRVGFDGGSLVHTTASNSYTPGRWNHVLVAWDGTQNASGVTFYVDGSGVSSSYLFDGVGTQYDSLWSWDLSANGPTLGLGGKLADLGVWTRVLDAGEKAALVLGYPPLWFQRELCFAPPLVRDGVDPVSGRSGVPGYLTPPEPFAHPPGIRRAGPLVLGRPGGGPSSPRLRSARPPGDASWPAAARGKSTPSVRWQDRFMADASDIHGVVFKIGSATLLARVGGGDGNPIARAQIAQAAYTVFLLDESDPDAAAAVAGHTDVPVAVAGLIYDALQTDALWDVDQTGYNFKHVLDVSAAAAFAVAGRIYRIEFRLTPVAGQVILVRFRVHAI
jgi:hypothetical protein